MSEELIEEDGLARVTSKWAPEELDGKTVCFTEIGGRDPVWHIGVIQAEKAHGYPGLLRVGVLVHDSVGDPRRAEYVVTQEIMNLMTQGSGPLVSDFHISEPVLGERGV